MSADNAGYILAAYVIAIAVTGAMIVSIASDYRALKRRLAALPARAEGDAET